MGHIQDCYLAIKNVVSALNKNETPLRNEAQLLARLINERFSFFYKVGTGFDPIYLVACALEPNYLHYLNEVEQRIAKSIIAKEVR